MFIAAGLTFIALLFSCCCPPELTGVLSFLALVLTFIAFWPHVALYQYVWHKMKHSDAHTELGFPLSMPFLALVPLLMAAAGMCPYR